MRMCGSFLLAFTFFAKWVSHSTNTTAVNPTGIWNSSHRSSRCPSHQDLDHSLSWKDKHRRNKSLCSIDHAHSSNIKSSFCARHSPDLSSPFCCHHRLGFLDILDSSHPWSTTWWDRCCSASEACFHKHQRIDPLLLYWSLLPGEGWWPVGCRQRGMDSSSWMRGTSLPQQLFWHH